MITRLFIFILLSQSAFAYDVRLNLLKLETCPFSEGYSFNSFIWSSQDAKFLKLAPNLPKDLQYVDCDKESSNPVCAYPVKILKKRVNGIDVFCVDGKQVGYAEFPKESLDKVTKDLEKKLGLKFRIKTRKELGNDKVIGNTQVALEKQKDYAVLLAKTTFQGNSTPPVFEVVIVRRQSFDDSLKNFEFLKKFAK